MKASSATSGEANAAASAATPTDAQPSANSPTPTADAPAGGYPLSGPSAHPNPRTHAFREDLADIALAGTVIASHYAVPLECRLKTAATLKASPNVGAEDLAQLEPGATLRILDKRGGWAWGYASDLVGYVPAAALSA